jgi:hypothetical protein
VTLFRGFAAFLRVLEGPVVACLEPLSELAATAVAVIVALRFSSSFLRSKVVSSLPYLVSTRLTCLISLSVAFLAFPPLFSL